MTRHLLIALSLAVFAVPVYAAPPTPPIYSAVATHDFATIASPFGICLSVSSTARRAVIDAHAGWSLAESLEHARPFLVNATTTVRKQHTDAIETGYAAAQGKWPFLVRAFLPGYPAIWAEKQMSDTMFNTCMAPEYAERERTQAENERSWVNALCGRTREIGKTIAKNHAEGLPLATMLGGAAALDADTRFASFLAELIRDIYTKDAWKSANAPIEAEMRCIAALSR